MRKIAVLVILAVVLGVFAIVFTIVPSHLAEKRIPGTKDTFRDRIQKADRLIWKHRVEQTYLLLPPTDGITFTVPDLGMLPLLGSKTYRFVVEPTQHRRLESGSLVLVHTPSGDLAVTRVAGIPGEMVEVKSGVLFINGGAVPERALARPQCGAGSPTAECVEERLGANAFKVIREPMSVRDFGPITVPSNAYYLLGDNREQSNDSRNWGPISSDSIVGVITSAKPNE